ncbi:unnamed protein product [Phaeothamnion confervicola]
MPHDSTAAAAAMSAYGMTTGISGATSGGLRHGLAPRMMANGANGRAGASIGGASSMGMGGIGGGLGLGLGLGGGKDDFRHTRQGSLGVGSSVAGGLSREEKRERRKKSLSGAGSSVGTGGVTGGDGSTAGSSHHDRVSELVAATAKLTLDSVRGSVHRMSKDQVGCRMLQTKLDEGDPETATAVYDEAKPHLLEMMVDPFGNYLFQKILERVTDEQRTEVALLVADRIVEAGRNLHGTRSVQKIIELAKSPDQVRPLTVALAAAAAELCMDANGNHVIQRVLQNMGAADNQFVFDALLGGCVKIATHRHGCCVMQRALDAADPAQRVALVHEVAEHALPLMQDPYGNYVVQYVLQMSSPAEAAGLVAAPLGQIAALSMQKFSSNVVEKCLERASDEVQAAYLAELSDALATAPRLLQDQFANYVVQRALVVAAQAAAERLVEAIKPHLPGMRNTSGGRRIATKILKRFPHADLADPRAGEGGVGGHNGHGGHGHGGNHHGNGGNHNGHGHGGLGGGHHDRHHHGGCHHGGGGHHHHRGPSHGSQYIGGGGASASAVGNGAVVGGGAVNAANAVTSVSGVTVVGGGMADGTIVNGGAGTGGHAGSDALTTLPPPIIDPIAPGAAAALVGGRA